MHNITKMIKEALKIFKEAFYLAKTSLDHMNTSLNGKISFEEFQKFSKFHPQSIDFIARLTLGPYPPSEEILSKLNLMQRHFMPQLDEQGANQEPSQQQQVNETTSASQ